MKNGVAQSYLKTSVESAPPLKLVVMLYDIVINSVKEASNAAATGNVEYRIAQVNRAMTALGELQGALDFEKGGEVAVELARLYAVSRQRLFEANSQISSEIFDRLTHDMISVRDAWKQVELTLAVSGNAIPASHPTPGARQLPDGAGGGAWSA